VSGVSTVLAPHRPDRYFMCVQRSGRLADRYRIELGRAGWRPCTLAEDLKHGRKVALKVLKPELAAVLGAERVVV
jgi:hypothetical protein